MDDYAGFFVSGQGNFGDGYCTPYITGDGHGKILTSVCDSGSPHIFYGSDSSYHQRMHTWNDADYYEHEFMKRTGLRLYNQLRYK